MGSWILAAALFFLEATAWIIHANIQETNKRHAQYIVSIKQTCIGEIKSFWDHVNSHDLIEKLNIQQKKLNSWKNSSDDENKPGLFRNHLGDDWFLLSHISPLALALG